MNSDLIISLDPSSTIVGFAAMGMDASLSKAGVITPDRRGAPSYERIRSLRRDLVTVFEQFRPDTILIEWTKGKVGRRHGGYGAGLAVYGCGVGAIATEADHWARDNPPCDVVPIFENDWTRGVPKSARQLAVAEMYPAYSTHQDPGGDIADAIGMAVWWLKERRLFGK